MRKTAVFLESTHLDGPQLQPLPDASDVGWDRWMLEVTGAVAPSWRNTTQLTPDAESQVRASISDD